jgi:DNA-binding NtrC family response regulator
MHAEKLDHDATFDAYPESAEDAAERLFVVATSLPMQELLDLVRRIARVDSTVLLTGESGSGKERIARLLHESSPRATGPFVAVNCGAVTETLLEAELFGHARGAFSGATNDRAGFFEAAHGGTLLLDEVGEVSPGMQVKLLRVVQEREIRRVGENKSRRIDVRIIAATNRDLARAVSGGTFRQDLYYRLRVVELHVPPLRDRREDVIALAGHLLADACVRMKRNIRGQSQPVAEQLLCYDWPGNVRELQNAIERAVALARGGQVELEDLPEEVQSAGTTLPQGTTRTLEDVEKEHILATLALNRGNQTRTAGQLNIGSATLYRKLKGYGIVKSRERSVRPALHKLS